MVRAPWETRSCRKQTAQPRAERRRRPPSKDAQTTGALRRQILWLSNRLNRVWKLRPWNGWAEHYDDNNPMIAAEECVVTPRLAELFTPGAAALDAGCDTGRHSAALADMSYHVIGTDLTPAMLNIARAKVPAAEFREGLFENLPDRWPDRRASVPLRRRIRPATRAQPCATNIGLCHRNDRDQVPHRLIGRAPLRRYDPRNEPWPQVLPPGCRRGTQRLAVRLNLGSHPDLTTGPIITGQSVTCLIDQQ